MGTQTDAILEPQVRCGTSVHAPLFSAAMTSHRSRAAGVLLHPTSLPGGHGIGDLGRSARDFVDWLAASGATCWQMLPLGPTGDDGSPYGSWSTFAGNPLLIDLDDLVDIGLLAASDLADPPANSDRVNFVAVREWKSERLIRAVDNLLQARGTLGDLWAGGLDGQPRWLDQHARYAALREASGRPWWEWPASWTIENSDAVFAEQRPIRLAYERHCAVQWLFDRQWRALHDHCNQRGISVFGDVPIYVAGDSTDVWAHRKLFDLDATGRPTSVSGVPPDAFSETGQRWGNPLYAWRRHRETDFAWWVERMRRSFELADMVRIDHFRGLQAFWAVPADAEDARTGHWVQGPGIALFDAVRERLGHVKLIAEDLGTIDEAVRTLQREAGLPGMSILQFAFGGGPENAYLPHNHVPGSVAYIGTHDNNTALGWWRDEASEATRHHVRTYLGVNGDDIVWDLVRACLSSTADLAIVTAQDLLALDTTGRMNLPGETKDNWSWRLLPGALGKWQAGRLCSLAELYGRVARR